METRKSPVAYAVGTFAWTFAILMGGVAFLAGAPKTAWLWYASLLGLLSAVTLLGSDFLGATPGLRAWLERHADPIIAVLFGVPLLIGMTGEVLGYDLLVSLLK